MDDMKKGMTLYSSWMLALKKQYDGEDSSVSELIHADQIAMELVDFIAETAPTQLFQ